MSYRTLPAGSNGQLHIDLGGMDGPIIRHQIGVVGHTINVQGHHRKLNVDDVVVPLLVADLKNGAREGQELKEHSMIFNH